LKEFKQEAQERNLYLLGSDVKQELSNIIDNFTTNFIDLTYQEVLSFLEIVRPGAERLVDELITEEELTGSELKVLAKEYLGQLRLYFTEISYKNFQSSLSQFASSYFSSTPKKLSLSRLQQLTRQKARFQEPRKVQKVSVPKTGLLNNLTMKTKQIGKILLEKAFFFREK
jgi:hypothetical protein